MNSSTNIDTISNFQFGSDKIELENAIFTMLGTTGALSADNFKIGGPTDDNDFILFDPSTDLLSYDADGNGAGVAVTFADVKYVGLNPPTASDFLVI